MKRQISKLHAFRLLAVLAAVTVILSSAFVGFSASAVAYNGKGTRSDPYLVQTAEQLQGMADNLSAHYKLANTIDLSSIAAFKPIGNLANPFTGSFTCDTDSDGTPKYAIKNLKVYNDAGERYGHRGGTNAGYVDYKEKNSNWEAALFGSAKGATFQNIALIDVNITNTVVGQNRMNNDWSLNPGQDEQAAAALVAIADAITVDNCSASGQISSRSNHCGGLFGNMVNSTVRNSYSTVNVQSSGLWCHGGFYGSGEANTITNCFASGKVDASSSRIGGFTGAGGGTLENCYSTGTVTKGNSFHDSEVDITLKNCVTLSKSADNMKSAGSNANGCLVIDAAGGNQPDFAAASQAQIQSVIDSINSKVKVISNTAKYVPGEVDLSGAQEQTPPAQSGNTQGETDNTPGGTTSANTTSDGTSAAKYTAEELTALAQELNEKAMQQTLTQEDALKGITIKEDYAALDPAEMDKVDDSVVAMFEQIYNESSKVLLSTITEEMEAVNEVTSENAAEIVALWEKYDGLPSAVKEYFDPELVEKLEGLYNEAKDMANVKVVTKEVDATVTRMQTVLIVVLVTVNVLALCGLGVLIYFIVRTLKKLKSTAGVDISSFSTEGTVSNEE